MDFKIVHIYFVYKVYIGPHYAPRSIVRLPLKTDLVVYVAAIFEWILFKRNWNTIQKCQKRGQNYGLVISDIAMLHYSNVCIKHFVWTFRFCCF